MPSTYLDWRAEYLAASAGQPQLVARLLVLEAESRVAATIAAFEVALVSAFDARLAGGAAAGRAAVDALDDSIRAIAGDPAFIFLLPITVGPFASASTHVTGRYLCSTLIDAYGRIADVIKVRYHHRPFDRR